MNKKFYTFRLRNLVVFALTVGITFAVAGLSAFLTRNSMDVYSDMAKPFLAPPAWVFPVVWSILYLLMGIAAYRIAVKDWQHPEVREAMFYYGLQLTVNFLWSIFFFLLEWYGFSFFWCGFLALLIAVTIAKFRVIDTAAGYLMVPYLIWVLFATYLNLGIWVMH